MNKALFRDRAKKLMITGVLAGVIAGVAITSGISSITLKKAEKKLEISNAKLQEQTKKNEELQAELDREEVTENIINAYKPEKKTVFEENSLDKVKIPEEFSNTIKYEVIRKDIDINKHMHNLYYLDLAYEALPDEIYNKRPFDYVRITYKKEIKLGEKVNCKYVEQDGKYVIVIKSEDETVIHAIVELQ